jgi:hypothetical protein
MAAGGAPGFLAYFAHGISFGAGTPPLLKLKTFPATRLLSRPSSEVLRGSVSRRILETLCVRSPIRSHPIFSSLFSIFEFYSGTFLFPI